MWVCSSIVAAAVFLSISTLAHYQVLIWLALETLGFVVVGVFFWLESFFLYLVSFIFPSFDQGAIRLAPKNTCVCSYNLAEGLFFLGYL